MSHCRKGESASQDRKQLKGISNKRFPVGLLRALGGNLPATQLLRFRLRKWCPKKIDRRKKRLTTKERRPIARHLGPNGRREYVTSDSQLADCFGWSRPKVARARKAISKYLRFDYRDNACYVSTRDDALIDLWEQVTGTTHEHHRTTDQEP